MLNSLLQLIFTGDEANYELAKQLAISQNINLNPIFDRLEICTKEFNAQTQHANLKPFELIASLKQENSSNSFGLPNNFSDAWAVFDDFLTHFNLFQHQWEYLPSVFQCFHKLKQLEVKNGKLLEIPSFLYELPNLERLDLFNNHFKIVDKAVQKAEKLTHLAISSIYFINVSDKIADLPNLTHFSFGVSNLLTPQQLPAVIYNCVGLQFLSVSGQCFYELMPDVQKLQKLTHLQLNYCKLKKFPKVLLQLNNLIHLELYYLDHAKLLINQIPHFYGLKKLTLCCDNYDFLQNKEAAGCLSTLESVEIYDFSSFFAGNKQQPNLKTTEMFLKTQLPQVKIIFYY
jgi:Leucine-rich repeat (LRR) protein